MSAEQLEAACGPRTVGVVLNSPSNPTGAVYSSDELRAIGQVALRRGLIVFTDDIYEHLAERPIEHIGALVPELRPQLVVVNSVSKTYAMTGWRIGYTAAPVELIKAMTALQSQSTSNPTSQAVVRREARHPRRGAAADSRRPGAPRLRRTRPSTAGNKKGDGSSPSPSLDSVWRSEAATCCSGRTPARPARPTTVLPMLPAPPWLRPRWHATKRPQLPACWRTPCRRWRASSGCQSLPVSSSCASPP